MIDPDLAMAEVVDKAGGVTSECWCSRGQALVFTIWVSTGEGGGV